jgi:DNA helicase HerA-like ATPase
LQVVGLTNEQEITVIDQHRPFRINEYLIIDDAELGYPRGEVVETQSFNRYRDFNLEKGIVGPEIFQSLKAINYDMNQHDIYIAKVRLLERQPVPIRPGTLVREPSFDEVAPYLVKGDPDKAMVLGVIHATEKLAAGMPESLQNRAKLLVDGRVMDQGGVPFLFDPRAMHQYPHIGIFGGSGSGKSFGLRVFLEELMKLKIPTLVFDPHFELTFAETPPGCPPGYRDVKFEQRFKVMQVGQDVGVDFTQLNTRDVITLLSASSALSEGMINAVEALHQRNDSFVTFLGRIDDLVIALENGEKGADREARGIPLSSLKGVQWRLKRLERAGLFTRDIRPIEATLREGKLVVVQGPIWVLNVFAAYVTSTLYHKRRDYKDAQFRREAGEYFPPFIMVTDEAHNFAPKAYDAPAKGIIKEIAQEGRKYGVFLILATQRPTLLDETVVAQLNTKCIFRTVRASDIATIKEETDLSQEEARRLPFLRSGDTYISSAIFGRTVPVRIRMAKTSSPNTENPFDELGAEAAQVEDAWAKILVPVVEEMGALDSGRLIEVARLLAKRGHSVTVEALAGHLERLAEEGYLAKRELFGMAQYWVEKAE